VSYTVFWKFSDFLVKSKFFAFYEFFMNSNFQKIVNLLYSFMYVAMKKSIYLLSLLCYFLKIPLDFLLSIQEKCNCILGLCVKNKILSRKISSAEYKGWRKFSLSVWSNFSLFRVTVTVFCNTFAVLQIVRFRISFNPICLCAVLLQ
jgi:hypothetical protein